MTIYSSHTTVGSTPNEFSLLTYICDKNRIEMNQEFGIQDLLNKNYGKALAVFDRCYTTSPTLYSKLLYCIAKCASGNIREAIHDAEKELKVFIEGRDLIFFHQSKLCTSQEEMLQFIGFEQDALNLRNQFLQSLGPKQVPLRFTSRLIPTIELCAALEHLKAANCGYAQHILNIELQNPSLSLLDQLYLKSFLILAYAGTKEITRAFALLQQLKTVINHANAICPPA